MNLNEIIRTRHTSKAYDHSRKLMAEQQQELLDLLRFSPSSVNSQPWHFFAVTTEEGKQQILPALMDANQVKAKNAAMTVVFTIKEELNEAHLLQLLEKEQQDGRYDSDEARAGNDKGRRFFVGLNSQTPEQQREWMTRQAYLALGFLLLGAAAMGLDATPIEGFHPEKMDELLGLKEKGLRSVVVATIGYRSDADFNATLPKSRLDQDVVITQL
ncbi:oxygen-insensitive NAD(P)H nitroreductase [Cronobacter turicensis]|nr:oxygen-insensitive NAD(P)H nitroreductase [Cronobacter turicensis]ELY4382355.1 oxygen-insensitive NAD(P)H nitroreductase [Cronobacter turicensis]ELY4386055.1 oxygen-insensitive NAD(P)H nitroreductase [Cronobacter turicensis]ELY6269411.1 oxygen-insensitive NAD(P)H nitroreductase [Cronobacter turicensis]ELY6272972.1 oxygen-insensitive NAD(P)H nitroreductase [Cronobacter turicensis]